MKVTIDNFNYRGVHFDEMTCTLPEHVQNLEDVTEEEITEYVMEHLNRIIDEGEV